MRSAVSSPQLSIDAQLAAVLQTLDSQWVAHEVNEARACGIPIICVVDADKQLQREVIDHYMEKGYSWLFDSQASCLFISLHLTALSCHLNSKGYFVQ